MAQHVREASRVSIRRTCGLMGRERSSFYYRSLAKDVTALVLRLKELARVRTRFGYRRLDELLRRGGGGGDHKRIHRLYVLHGLPLSLRRKQNAPVTCGCRWARPSGPMRPGAWTSCTMCWTMAAGSG